MRALFVFTPAESKRLIGKAVANIEEVKRAKEYGKILIGHGSTNIYVAEVILGREKVAQLINKDIYLSGVILRGTLCTTLAEEKPPILLLNRGKVEPPAPTMSEILREFGQDSVFIKGANAVDPEGNAGVFMAHPEGETIGWSIGTIIARGIKLIVPVGLEKLVPSVKKAVSLCGQQTLDYCQGLKVGMMPLSSAKVITEVEALRILAGVESYHVASGGNAGSEGSVVLVAEGDAPEIERVVKLLESIKGEPSLLPRKGICLTCVLSSPALPKEERTGERFKLCPYQYKTENELPSYLRNR